MRKLMLFAALVGLLLPMAGCANGPVRSWFRGAACNSCQPRLVRPFWRANRAGMCDDGSCSTEVFDSAPASIPADQIDGAVPYYEGGSNTGVLPSGDVYGNTDMVQPPQIGPVDQ